jgi:hypothetical protein
MKALPVQIDTFEDEEGAPYGMTIVLLPGLFLLYPQAEMWPAPVESLHKSVRPLHRRV